MTLEKHWIYYPSWKTEHYHIPEVLSYLPMEVFPFPGEKFYVEFCVHHAQMMFSWTNKFTLGLFLICVNRTI